MIRINLLGGERQVKKRAIAFDLGKRLTLACSLILVLAAAGRPSPLLDLSPRAGGSGR